jgi:hypothetical protein
MQILDYEYIYIFAIQRFNLIVHNMKNLLFIAILITLTGCYRIQSFGLYNKTNEPVRMYCYYDSRNHIDSSVYIPPSGYYNLPFITVKLKIVNVANLYMNHMDSVILKLPNREIVYKDSLSIYNFFYMRDTSVIKSVPKKGLLYDAMKERGMPLREFEP